MSTSRLTKIVWLIASVTLAGCSLTGDEVRLNDSIIQERTKQIQAKADVAVKVAEACKPAATDPAVCGGDTSCVAMVVMANTMAASSQTDCVEAVADKAADVAIAVPETIKSGFAEGMTALFGGGNWLDNNTGSIMNFLFGKAAFDFADSAVSATSAALVSAGRPNITTDNSSTTTISDSGNTTESNGNTSAGDGAVIGDGQIGDNATTNTLVDNGSQLGDQDNDITCTGDDCRQGSAGDNFDNQDNSSPSPDPVVVGAADGFCPTFVDPASDPDC